MADPIKMPQNRFWMMYLKNRRICLISAAVLVFVGSVVAGNAEEFDNYEGSYFCVTDAVGGVSFDETLNTWVSTRFSPNSRYVVNISEHSETTDWLGELRTVYTVNVSEHGVSESDALSNLCSTSNDTLRSYNTLTHFISETGAFSCNRFGGEWYMNLENERFMSTYTWGYVDGIDNNSNTPAIQIGTCSRIN